MTGWQIPGSAVVGRVWDVAIVGCGPAGAIAAHHLARGGLDVVVLERQTFPREKVCGDALLPDAFNVLARAGLLEVVVRSGYVASRLLFFSPSGVQVPIPTNSLVIRRCVLDSLLAEAAANVGAVIARGRVTSVDAASEVPTLVLDDHDEVRARIVLVATGAEVRLLDSLGMVSRGLATGVAVRCYVRSSAVIEDLIVSFERTIPNGYAWIFPLGDGLYNVGCGINNLGQRRSSMNLERALIEFLGESSVARDLSRGMSSQSSIRGATLRAGLIGTTARHRTNLLTTGESLGATLPLSGEGIGKAMETGELAASVILHAFETGDMVKLIGYDERVEALRPLYRGYSIAQHWLSKPWLNDLIATLVRGSPYTLTQLEAIMNETRNPREVFSVEGVWKMLTR